MSVDYMRGVTGRDPLGKTLVAALLNRHPDWSDEHVAARINREYETPVIDAAEVAHWRVHDEVTA
jgi:hypothetical protein